MPRSRIIFDSAIGIGIRRKISDSPVTNRMKPKTPTAILSINESAVRDREERLRAILETAVEGIITIDERGQI
jgi:PAS domain-containing protein